jgi:hypothetical protein
MNTDTNKANTEHAMNISMSFTALIALTLLGCLSGNAWAEETTLYESIAQGEQATAANGDDTPAQQVPSTPAVPGQYWQQPRRWGMPQPMYRQVQPQYPYGGQYRTYPGAPATTAAKPHDTELEKVQEQLAGKSGELEDAYNTIEQLRAELEESHATETRLSDKLTYNTREQQALRMRVIELNQALEQQHQQLIAERDQRHSELASLDVQLAELQSRLQEAGELLAQARSSTGMTGDAPGTARMQIEALRDALGKLEAELERQESGPLNREP